MSLGDLGSTVDNGTTRLTATVTVSQRIINQRATGKIEACWVGQLHGSSASTGILVVEGGAESSKQRQKRHGGYSGGRARTRRVHRQV